MADYVAVGRLEHLPCGAGTVVTVGNTDVALFNVDGTVCAIADACLHQGMSLGGSALEGRVVTCRAHGWRYDVTTGNTPHVPGYGVATYPVKLVDGTILIAVGSPPPAA